MRLFVGVSIAVLALAAPVAAQRQATPEQRIDRLERQLRQVQGRVFQRGQPADTAGLDYEPAAPLSSVTRVSDRLAALERQMADILRLSEENGNRLRTIESDLAQARTEQSNRIGALERRVQELSVQGPPGGLEISTPSASAPTGTQPAQRPVTTPPATNATTSMTEEDPGEEAYSVGFRLWRDGKYQEAIAALRAFTSAYPNHRRVSWANNLAGRAMLDAGQPRPAADALLSNYRANPNGERAPDSLYYLGQSLMQLGQPTQACNAYAELEAVYGSRMRDELKRLLPDAKAQAQCR